MFKKVVHLLAFILLFFLLVYQQAITKAGAKADQAKFDADVKRKIADAKRK